MPLEFGRETRTNEFLSLLTGFEDNLAEDMQLALGYVGLRWNGEAHV